MQLDATDRRIIARLCDDLDDSLYPYQALAAELDITETALLARLRAYREAGVMRRFGAMLRHQHAGYTANALSAWQVPDAELTRVGALLAARAEISHCYARPPLPDWPYTLYAMIHGHSQDDCRTLADRLAQQSGISDYTLLFSLHEYKKTSMRYFSEEAVIPNAC
ncbi:MAG TPA: Lrp/AsnC family transcriptional regulator [Armatimonadota bacterium]|jgi:DNA-binding Lrp family transcriptional regulator